MGFFIGMDEAGYGPNLGPLVITATLWEVPGDPRQFDFWAAMESFVTQTAPKKRRGQTTKEQQDHRLHIADSKNVYSPSKGISALERSILMTMKLADIIPDSLHQLANQLTPDDNFSLNIEPWFSDRDIKLPLTKSDHPNDKTLFLNWQSHCNNIGVKLLAVKSEIVLTERFNNQIEQYNNKAMALSMTSMQLLSHLWKKECQDNSNEGQTLIVADKHGGRNRYDDLLATIVEDEMIFRHEEGTALSRYTVNNSEIRFQTKAEAHFPVAVASMVCKYVRELAMELFNQFWIEHIPGLKPTKGYPQDARRYLQEISTTQQELNIPQKQLWRMR